MYSKLANLKFTIMQPKNDKIVKFQKMHLKNGNFMSIAINAHILHFLALILWPIFAMSIYFGALIMTIFLIGFESRFCFSLNE